MLDFESRLLRLQAKLESQYIQLQQLSSLNINELRRPYFPAATSDNMEPMDNDGDGAQGLPPPELNHYYSIFFSNIVGTPSPSTNLSKLNILRTQFNAIARIEIGEPFHNAATFTQEINGSVRIHVDWHYLYANRSLLENNWRSGCYQATQLDGAPDVVQPNQREGIYCVVFDRNLLAAGSRDNVIRLWSMEDLYYRGRLEAHEGSVLCLQLDSKRGILVSGSSDSTIKIWDLHTGKVIQTLQGHSESVLGLHLTDKYLVSCSRDNTARIWQLHETSSPKEEDLTHTSHSQTEGQCSQLRTKFLSLHVLRGHRAAVNSVHVRDEIIATASGDRTVKLWNLTSGTMIRTIGAHTRGIACVSLTEKAVVTGSSDHVIKIFNLENGENIRILRGHNGLVRTIQTDNTKIISGSYDQSIRIWDLKSGDMLQELNNCHDSKYFSYVFRVAY
jgi:WD40 repeat protein